ncbi:glycosyltransferase family 9 protein [Olivibacter sp. XZL3]|uniref:glycosyltransferase family 9 protein n=1 Tax=Olivibacter sp. XZL3 TaxID=1735116 RepID=UPI001064658E|nr:glycosyltransferase family 9 protein [Olivibacter sp. XZL3]
MNRIIRDVKKIAILRANALGDLLVVLPAVNALRRTYVDAEIVLLGSPWHATFLANKRTDIDRVIVIPIYKYIREENQQAEDKQEIESFFQRMQDERFDIAIHFQGRGVAANPFIKRLKARITVGHTCEEAVPLDYSIPYVHYQHEVLRYLELVEQIGAVRSTLDPVVDLFPAELKEADRILQSLAIDRPYVVLHPGAKDLRRRWLPDKFAQLADELAKEGHTVLFTGDDEDESYIQQLMSNMRSSAAYACRQMPLTTLAALLAKSQLVISNDTGPLHLARAVGAKTLGLYWAPNFIKWGPLNMRKHRHVTSWDMQCPRCGMVPNTPYPFEPKHPDCEHLFSFVRGLEVREVLIEAKRLLSDELHENEGYYKE